MSTKNQVACCPNCGSRIPFKKFIQLNNFSVINCGTCNARIEISNRGSNAIIAGASGILSAASLVLGAYLGLKNYNSLLGGVFFGFCLAVINTVFICMYAYRHSDLNRFGAENDSIPSNG